MNMNRGQQGFTIIELILSITFISALMMLAAALLMQSINIYSKGTSLKQVNQAGREIVEEINRAGASGFDVHIDDNGRIGYLCIDMAQNQQVYVWNSLEAAGTDVYRAGTTPITLARLEGDSAACPGMLESYDFDSADVVSLLSSQVRMLGVDIVESSSPSLKKVRFWFGTCDGSVNCTSNVAGMKPTYNASGSPKWRCPTISLGSYCATSSFEAIIYTPNNEE